MVRRSVGSSDDGLSDGLGLGGSVGMGELDAVAEGTTAVAELDTITVACSMILLYVSFRTM
jgi:hypothetical protein